MHLYSNKKLHCLMIGIFVSIATGCQLPTNQSLPEEQITPLNVWAKDSKEYQKIEQGLTAYHPLDGAFISIAARLHLIQKAQQHLDLQYYIWKDDRIGKIMLYALLNAADRGVKVRILLDDQNGTQLDHVLKTLAQHPNIQIKIFNPYKFRHFRVLDYGLRFKHINHRMHNKLIIADGATAVTGGRNISSEYFDASDDFQFTDMDILFYGEAIHAANQSFHVFWNDELSYSAQQLLGEQSKQSLEQLRQSYAQEYRHQTQIRIRLEDSKQKLTKDLRLDEIQWDKAYFVADHPNKAKQKAGAKQQIRHQMYQHLGEAKTQMDIVSAYFVPTPMGTEYLSRLAKNGVDVQILTNSYLANDVPIVHAFYQKYRKELLKNGVKLYEFKPYIERPKRTWYEVATGNIIPAKGKSASSLHAKFFDVDGKIYIGSFNFDPRSNAINTEVGLIVESSALQQRVHQQLDQYLPQVAYRLALNKKDEIIWIESHENGTETIHEIEPNTSKFQRAVIQILANTPFEWMM